MEFFLEYAYVIWLVWVFGVGAVVGSYLNVCIGRLPLEKSILWPSSRCMNCLRPIRWFDNLPLIGYLRLRGRCRDCGTRFSSRYFFVELFTACAFAGLFYVDVIVNWFAIPEFEQQGHAIRSFGGVPAEAWIFFFYHALFVSLLIIAAVCDLDRREIPLSVTTTGAAIGLIGAMLFPWPWPSDPAVAVAMPAGEGWYPLKYEGKIPLGMYPWPVWGPLPSWLPAGSWQLGLATGLVGAFVGLMMLRAVRFIFNRGLGKEALGLGDADLMMMAGAFLGWQLIVVAFFVGAIAALVIALPMLIIKGDNALPFGPGLAVGLVVTLYGWPTLGPSLQFLLFDGFQLALLTGMAMVFLFVASLALRR